MSVRSKTDYSLYGFALSIAAVLTGLSAAWSTIAMPITPYDTLVYLLLPSLAAVMTIRWARRTPEWSWPVLITHQIVLSALYFSLYLGLWVLFFMALWGGGYMLPGLFSLPLLVLVGRYWKTRGLAGDETTDARRAIGIGLGMSCLAYAVYAAYQLRAIFKSASETAVVGGLWDFLLIAPIVLLGSFAVAWSAATLIHTVRETASVNPDGQAGLGDRARAAMAVGVILAALFGLALAGGYREVLLREASSAQTGEDLETLHARPWVRHDKVVLGAMAHNPNATRQLLETLSAQEDVYVRMQVAANLQTPRALLFRLHSDRGLDSTLALNPNTPSGILDDIARSGGEMARWNVASNPTTMNETLVLLSEDSEERIRRRAIVRLKLRQQQAQGGRQQD